MSKVLQILLQRLEHFLLKLKQPIIIQYLRRLSELILWARQKTSQRDESTSSASVTPPTDFSKVLDAEKLFDHDIPWQPSARLERGQSVHGVKDKRSWLMPSQKRLRGHPGI